MASKRDRGDQGATVEDDQSGLGVEEHSRGAEERPAAKARSQRAAVAQDAATTATDAQSELWRTCARLQMRPEFRARPVLSARTDGGASLFEVMVVLDGVDFAFASDANLATV